MQLYPAVKAKMGSWDYYIVRMSMREIAQDISFAEEVHGTTQLSGAIQRGLKKSRSTKEIAVYLARHEDRFFGAIVVAALGGDPQWYPVRLEENPEFRILADDTLLSEAFGVLKFNGRERYYALDGQHRLAAIRALRDGEADYSAPEGFLDEQISVIIVTPRQLEDRGEFLARYRRLFGHLNRYAKAMSQFDNIIMDEDDALAIITRRLVTQHHFFRDHGDSQFESARVKMSPGKNVPSGSSSYFTSLEILYELNCRLLSTRERRSEGWGQQREALAMYKRFRPSEEEIDSLEEELFVCWDSLVAALPMLNEDPAKMRNHCPPVMRDSESEGEDCVLFWPIVQLILVDIVRELLDDERARVAGTGESRMLTVAESQHALEPLSSLTWDAHSPPWRYVLLIPPAGSGNQWRIANEDRKGRERLIERILRWQLGIDPLTEREISGADGIKEIWRSYLSVDAEGQAEAMWQEVVLGVQV